MKILVMARRLGHVSFDHLSRINSKDSVKDIPYLKFEKDCICDACQLERQTKSFFKTIKNIMTSRHLELIYMNLFGSTKIKNLSGNCFVSVLVDDFLRFIWVFFLEHKDEVFSHFHVFRKIIEKEKNFSILSIKS